MSDSYNGWRNRETWLVSLWFGGVFTSITDDGETVTSDYIEMFVCDYVDSITTESHGFLRDMMDINCIDWDELAAHYAGSDA